MPEAHIRSDKRKWRPAGATKIRDQLKTKILNRKPSNNLVQLRDGTVEIGLQDQKSEYNQQTAGRTSHCFSEKSITVHKYYM